MRYRLLMSGVVSLSVLAGVASAEPLQINPYPEQLPIAKMPAEVIDPAPQVDMQAEPEVAMPLPALEPIDAPAQAVFEGISEPAPSKPVIQKKVLAENVYIPKPGDAYFDPPSEDVLAPVMSQEPVQAQAPLSEPIEMGDVGLRPEDTYEPDVQIVEVQPITRVKAQHTTQNVNQDLAPGQSVPLAAQTRQVEIEVVDQTQPTSPASGPLQVRMSDDFEDLSAPLDMNASGEPYSKPIDIADVQPQQDAEDDLDVVVLDGKPDDMDEQDVVVLGPDDQKTQALAAEDAAKIETAAAPIETPVETIAWGVQQQNVSSGEIAAWHALPGTDVRAILEGWSNEAGVRMIWDSHTEYSILSKFTARGDYTDAVQGLLDQYAQSEVRPVATLHVDAQSGEKTLVIRDLDGVHDGAHDGA